MLKVLNHFEDLVRFIVFNNLIILVFLLKLFLFLLIHVNRALFIYIIAFRVDVCQRFILIFSVALKLTIVYFWEIFIFIGYALAVEWDLFVKIIFHIIIVVIQILLIFVLDRQVLLIILTFIVFSIIIIAFIQSIILFIIIFIRLLLLLWPCYHLFIIILPLPLLSLLFTPIVVPLFLLLLLAAPLPPLPRTRFLLLSLHLFNYRCRLLLVLLVELLDGLRALVHLLFKPVVHAILPHVLQVQVLSVHFIVAEALQFLELVDEVAGH